MNTQYAIQMPKEASEVITRLEAAGYCAYAVGGCVRDALLGREAADWDIATSARPQEVQRVFSDYPVIETGIRHGTVTVRIEGKSIEITTYRIDGAYTDNRHPDQVTYTSRIEEDLARRDFTINALAYHPKRGLVDPFGGMEDLKNGYIQAVGDANQRFSEDALRILRAIRFASVLSFTISQETKEAIFSHKMRLKNVAAERVRIELEKLLLGQDAEKILNEYWQVLAVWIPEITPMVGFAQNNPHHVLDVWGHTVKSVTSIAPIPVLRLAMLLHDVEKPNCYSVGKDGVGHFYGHQAPGATTAKKILKRLRYDNKTLEEVYLLIYYHDQDIFADEVDVKNWLRKLGEPLLKKLLLVKRADALAQAPDKLPAKLQALEKVEAVLKKVLREGACYSLSQLAIDGRDLLQAGIGEGPQLGALLEKLLTAVIQGRLKNEKCVLLEAATKEKEKAEKRREE